MAATGHSAFSPSSSKMWLNCSGSLIPNILLNDNSAGPEAAEGTVAHDLADTWLTKGRKAAQSRVGEIVVEDEHPVEITEEMLSYVSDYVDYVQEIEQEAVESWTETRVDFSDLTPIPDQGGTSDHMALVEIAGKNFAHELVVTDLKYGKGIRVTAEGNTQARFYAYGSWRKLKDSYNIVRVRIRIFHPRLIEGATEEVISIDDLLDFAVYARARAHAAWQWNAPRTPSEEACQWCKITDCAARYMQLAEVTSHVWDDEDSDEEFDYTDEEQRAGAEQIDDDMSGPAFRPAKPAALSTKALAKILRYRKQMEKFFAEIEEELLKRAVSDEEEIPGWKVVEGRTIRRWPDEVAVYKHLKKLGLKDGAIYTESIISPAQAEEKLHAKAGLSKEEAANAVNVLAFKPRGSRSLVRSSDKREARLTSADVFADDD